MDHPFLQTHFTFLPPPTATATAVDDHDHEPEETAYDESVPTRYTMKTLYRPGSKPISPSFSRPTATVSKDTNTNTTSTPSTPVPPDATPAPSHTPTYVDLEPRHVTTKCMMTGCSGYLPGHCHCVEVVTLGLPRPPKPCKGIPWPLMHFMVVATDDPLHELENDLDSPRTGEDWLHDNHEPNPKPKTMTL
jgi:hypothetical protein